MTTLVPRTHGRQTTDHPSATPAPATSRSWLTRLLAGEFELPAVAPIALPASGIPAERALLARALACPDLFIIDAAERTVRERLLAKLLHLAAERGERVLALSPDPAAADRLVEALGAERMRVVRALAEDENPQRPVAGISQFTSRAQGIGRAEQLRREAALGISALEAKLSRFDRTRMVRTRLEEIERQRRALQAEREGLADSKQVEAGIAAELDAIRLRRDAALAPLAAERGVLAAKRAEKEAAVQAARAQAAHSKKPGFLARLLGAKPTAPPDSTVVGDLESEAHALAKRENELQAEADAATRPFTSEMERATAAAADARRAALEKSLAELEPEASRLEQTLREFLPKNAVDDTVEAGTLAANRGDLERELAIARTRQEEFAHAGPDLARRLLAETKIVVGTPGSLTADPIFKAFGETPAFGLLILDHAEELTEADFEPLMALANRWVLAGNAAMPEEPRPHLNGHGHGHALRRSHEPTLLARWRADSMPSRGPSRTIASYFGSSSLRRTSARR